MKHTKQQAKKAKKILVDYHNYRDCDFYETENSVLLLTKDEVWVSAYDVVEFLKEENNCSLNFFARNARIIK